MWNENPIPSSARSNRTLDHCASETTRSCSSVTSLLKSLTIILSLRCNFVGFGNVFHGFDQNVEAFLEHVLGRGQRGKHLDDLVIGARRLDNQTLLEGAR